MATLKYKPTTPARRHMSVPVYKDTITKDTPEKSLVVLPEVNAYVVKSCANIPGAKTCLYNTINVYDILNADTFITTVAAVKMLEEVYA